MKVFSVSPSRFSAASARSALARDRRLASERGCSARSGVSSISAGTSRSGSMPACCSSSIRRGEAEASTSLWKTLMEILSSHGSGRRFYLKR